MMTIDDYERQRWLDEIRSAVKTLFEHAVEPLHIVELYTFALRWEEQSSPNSFSVSVPLTQAYAVTTPETIQKVAEDILNSFWADRRWRYARPRLEGGRSGETFRIYVHDVSDPFIASPL